MLEIVSFYFFAALIISLFSISVLTSNMLYALTSLVCGMVFVGALFFLLNADFLGVIQILVYSGAIVVLYAFSMMFISSTEAVKENNPSYLSVFSLSVLTSFLLVVIFVAPIAGESYTQLQSLGELTNTELIGRALFSDYLIAFEITAVLLLVALVAGIIISSKAQDQTAEAKE